VLKHLVPGLTEGRIANSHDHLIGWGLAGGLTPPIRIPGKRQDTQDRCSAHQGACGQGVVEKAHDVVATGSNGITNGAAMAAAPWINQRWAISCGMRAQREQPPSDLARCPGIVQRQQA